MKYFITLAFVVFCNTCFSQTGFIWVKSDTTTKSGSQIYSDTKMFIAETWKSSKSVIQNDDKEGGNILIKGVCVKSNTYSMMLIKYTYAYTVTFKMKNGKYKITIDNVYCENATASDREIKKIEPFDGEDVPEMNAFTTSSLPKKKMIGLMKEVKAELQSIFDSYSVYISKPSSNENW